MQRISPGFPVPASDALLNATAALLLIALGRQAPGLRPRMGRSGLGFLALGTLLPLLDPLRFSFGSDDQIEFLTQNPVFSGPLPGLALVLLAAGAALLLGAPAGRCVRWAGWTCGGLLLETGLTSLTPGGTAWLAPFSAHRYAAPLLPHGHLWLIVVAAVTLALVELWPRRRGRLLAGAGALLLSHALVGAIGLFGLANGLPPGAGASRDSVPDPIWPGRWLDIAVDGEAYTAVTRGLGSGGDVPSRMPRWNDQQLLLRVLEDPVVRRLYFEVFRHPVARIASSGSQIRLTVRELADALVDAPGPALLLETDAHGRHRRYQVERLD